MAVTKDVLKSRNPGCLKQTAQFAPAKLNPVYGRFSKGRRNEASGKFSHLILDHPNDCTECADASSYNNHKKKGAV